MPIFRFLFVFVASLGLLYSQSAASTASDRKLAFVIPGLIQDLISQLPAGLKSLAGPAAAPRISLASLNSGLAAELSNLPSSSSASALRYIFDPNVGAYVPAAQSLGPILTERAETIGKDKIFVALTYQRFQFDHQDGLDLRNIRTAFPIPIPAGILGPLPSQAIADVTASLGVVVNETTAHFTYGITRWLDASYAFSVVSNSISFQTAVIFKSDQLGPSGLPVSAAVQRSSSGLGDGVAKIKAKIYDRGGLALALATDIRLPIGDEFNLQGAGAFGIKPQFIASYTSHAFSPHVNASYEWNGRSYLASSTGLEKQKLPSQVSYSVGADVAASQRLTLSFDLLDQIVLNAPGLRLVTETVGSDQFQNIDYLNRTRHEVNGAAGFKVRLTSDVALTGNLLFRVNEAGLRTRIVPLIGLSHVF
jgi:hypothetical protein